MVQANLDPDYALAKDLQTAKDRLARLEALLFTAASGGGSFTVSATAPASPTNGAGWYNLSNGLIFFYVNDGDSSQWVQDTSIANDAGYDSRITALETFNTVPQAVSVGGTGASSLTAGGYLKGNGTSAVTSQVGIPGSDINSYMSPNVIINGAMDFWQRGTSFNTNAAYSADRWQIAFSGTGTAMTTTQQSFTPGAAPVSGYESAYFIRHVVTGGSGTSSLAVMQQPIEDVRTLAGQTVTVSFWAKASSGTPYIGYDFYQSFGGGGSTTVGGIGANKVTVSTSWARYSITISVPSISGKTIGTNGALVSRLWFSSGSDYNSLNGSMGIQSNTFDIWGVQVEQGSVATPFRRNANSIQGELAACQRYYATKGNISNFETSAAFASTDSVLTSGTFSFPVTMRTSTPTITTYDIGGTAGQAHRQYVGSGGGANVAVTQAGITAYGFYVISTISGGDKAGKYYLYYTASAEL